MPLDPASLGGSLPTVSCRPSPINLFKAGTGTEGALDRSQSTEGPHDLLRWAFPELRFLEGKCEASTSDECYSCNLFSKSVCQRTP